MGEKKALVVVDYQNDFVEGSLGFERAIMIEPTIYHKVEEYYKNNDNIIFTMDTHYDNYLNTQEGKNLPVKHCIFGTYGWNLYGRLYDFYENNKNKDNVTMLNKDTFGCYPLGEFLLNNNFEEIELCGVVTSMCVLSNAVFIKTIVPETRIVINKYAVADFDSSNNEKALEILKNIHVKVI